MEFCFRNEMIKRRKKGSGGHASARHTIFAASSTILQVKKKIATVLEKIVKTGKRVFIFRERRMSYHFGMKGKMGRNQTKERKRLED